MVFFQMRQKRLTGAHIKKFVTLHTFRHFRAILPKLFNLRRVQLLNHYYNRG